MSEEHSRSAINCSNCGATLTIDETKELTQCAFCGAYHPTSQLLGESEAIRLQKLKAKERQEAWERETAEENRRRAEAERKAEEQRKNQPVKGPLIGFIIAGIAFLLLVMIGCIDEEYLITSAIVAGQIAFLIIGLLMAKRVIKTKKPKFFVIPLILAAVLFLPFVVAIEYEDTYPSYKDYDAVYTWPTSGLGGQLPTPSSINGKVSGNNVSYFSADIYNMNQSDVNEYIDAVQKAGFVNNQRITDTIYSAFNSEGYQVELYYFKEAKELDISIDSPKGQGNLTWPTGDLASKLPAPDSTQGIVKSNTSTNFNAEVGAYDKNKFAAYVEKCIQAGWNREQSNTGVWFSATDKDGNTLSLELYGDDVMLISCWHKS